MGRGLLGLVVCWLVVVAAACVDLCVASGRPCDSSGDCAGGEVCRLQRSGEAPCVFARGMCEAHECGSAQDCARAECCDPEQNVCIAEYLFDGPCDPQSCRDCDQLCEAPPCDAP